MVGHGAGKMIWPPEAPESEDNEEE
jgi:hypothetical protein